MRSLWGRMLASNDATTTVPGDFRLVEAGRVLIPRIERAVAQLRAVLRVHRLVHWDATYKPLLLKTACRNVVSSSA